MRLCAKTTKETPLLPMVRLRPGVLSRPTWFAEVRRDDLNAPNCQYGLAVNKKHAQSPEHAQSAQGKSAFQEADDPTDRDLQACVYETATTTLTPSAALDWAESSRMAFRAVARHTPSVLATFCTLIPVFLRSLAA